MHAGTWKQKASNICIINYLLTESEVFTVKYQSEVCKAEVSKAEVSKAEVSKVEVSKAEVSKVEVSKAEVWYFNVKTEPSRLISSLLYGTFYYENQYNQN